MSDSVDVEQKKLDKEVIRTLYRLLSKSFVERIRAYIRESGTTYNYRIRERNIVGMHCVGDEPFDDVWYTYNEDEDEFFGQISIGLHNGLYFCYNYSKPY